MSLSGIPQGGLITKTCSFLVSKRLATTQCTPYDLMAPSACVSVPSESICCTLPSDFTVLHRAIKLLDSTRRHQTSWQCSLPSDFIVMHRAIIFHGRIHTAIRSQGRMHTATSPQPLEHLWGGSENRDPAQCQDPPGWIERITCHTHVAFLREKGNKGRETKKKRSKERERNGKDKTRHKTKQTQRRGKARMEGEWKEGKQVERT